MNHSYSKQPKKKQIEKSKIPLNLERSHVVFIWSYHVLWCFIHVFNVIKCCVLSFVVPFLGGYGWLLYRFAIGCSRHGSEVVPRGLEGVLPRKSPGGATWSMGKWWENDDGWKIWMDGFDGFDGFRVQWSGFPSNMFENITCKKTSFANRPCPDAESGVLINCKDDEKSSVIKNEAWETPWHPGWLFFSRLNYWCQLVMIMKYHYVLGLFGLGNRWKHQLVFHETWKRDKRLSNVPV